MAEPSARRPRVAVVGAGYWGKNLVRNFGELDALAAVVDADTSLAQTLASAHGAKPSSLQDVLSDPSIDGIVIAAPAALHFELAHKALSAGKHTYVEKPIALKKADAQALIRLADQNDRRLMVGHLLQYHPAFLALKQTVASGLLGKLRYVYSNRISFGKIRSEEDVLWSFAPHDISMVLSLAGEMPDSVTASGADSLQPGISDFAQIQLGFPSGLRGHVFVSWLHPFKEQRLVVVGDKAMAVFEDSASGERKLMLYEHSASIGEGGAPVTAKGREVPIPYEASEPLKAECRHFLDCIATGARPRTDGEEGLRVLDVLERASAGLGGKGKTAATGSPRVVGRFPEVKIHESAYVDADVEIGAGTRIWHFSHILGNVRIGRNVAIGQNVVIGPKVTVGDNCKVQNNVSLYDGVTLEEGVFCGPSCVFTNVNNPRAEIERKSEFRQTLVKRGATIGANATIVCGHTLGEYCFIAAGAVVTTDVPPYATMAGVPARRIGWMSKAGYKLGPDLVCPATGARYRAAGPDRIEEIA